MRPELGELLPWYVAGALDPEEHAQLAAHLSVCGACRREAELLSAVREVLRAEEGVEPGAGVDLYRRTRERLRPGGMRRLVETVRRAVLPVPVYARVALAAQLAVIVLLAGALLSGKGAVTLSGTPETPAPGLRVQVVFKEGATAGEISRTLSRLNARIVEGPSPLGVYVLELHPAGGEPRTEVLRRIRASGVVAFADLVESR